MQRVKDILSSMGWLVKKDEKRVAKIPIEKIKWNSENIQIMPPEKSVKEE